MKTIFTHSTKLATLIILSYFSISTVVGQTAPVIFPYDGFGIDGDLKANNPTSNIGDWIPGTGGSGEYVFKLDGTAVNTATTYKFTDIYNSTGDNIFTGGGKFNDDPNTLWSWTNNKAGGKGDINNVLIHLGTDISNNQWLIIASDRLVTTGTSYIDFEFFQNTLTANAGGSFTLAGGRTVGDILLSVEYSNGGSTATVKFYKWSGTDYVLVTDPSTNAFGQTNTTIADTMTGGAFGTSQYTAYQFVEAAINISAFFAINDPCAGAQFGSVLIKTKSSNSPSASLDDFAGPYPVKLVLGTASISYGDGSFCKNEGSVDVTLDGVTGGVFSAAPGLSINPTTGKIDITTSTSGTYTVTYSFTTGGCPKSVTTQVTINALPTASIGSIINVNCKGGATGSATASATGGTAGYTYSWNTTPVQNTAIASGLAAGTYTVTVTDSKGCTDTEQVTITEPTNSLLAAIDSKVDVNCKGGATGSATASATGGTAGYTYSWNTTPVQNTAIASGLAAGTYTVTVTDSKGCTDTEQVTITEPTNSLLAAINSKVDVNCKGGATGSATASATGGTAGYTYSWNTTPVQNTAIASGLAAGTYTVTVTDSKGCTDTEQVTITEPTNSLLAAINSKVDVNCKGGATGSATASATGGTAGYTYSWNTTPVQNTAIASGLAAGTYTVTVTDSKGCTDTEQVTITEPTNSLLAAINSKVDVNCKGGATGSATASATGGTAGYTYSWNTTPVQNTAIASGLAAGTYTVTVTDSKGCTDTEQVTITEPTNSLLAAINSKVDVNCKGGATGSATASATGGTAGYTYSWNTTPVQNTAIASGLAAGTYTVTVTDSKGCTDTEQVTITEPTNALLAAINSKVDVNCKGGATGSATASATGGTAGYTYSWNTTPVQNTAIASGLAAGTYTVTVTDSKGCTDTEQVTITEPTNALLAAINSKINVNCKGGATGSATASATGGTAGYAYSWNTTPVQNTAIASGLTAGTYTVTVTDSKGCTDTEQVTITEPTNALLAAINSKVNVNCKGGATGSATASATGGTAGYTYSWNTTPVQNTAIASGLTAGTYTVTVTDSKGCTDTEQVTITEPQDVLSCSIVQNKTVTANGLSDGQATVTPLGGNGGYTYLWDNGETTVKAIALNVGLHTVTVTDSKGCKTTCDVTMTQPDVLSCSIVQNAPAKCYGDSNGIATVTAVGGNIGYTYLWDNAETTAQAIALSAGNHTVTVTDNLGYKTTCNVTIGQPEAAITCSVIQNKAVTANGLSDGQATVTPLGGNGGYTYLWDNEETTVKAVALNAGLHTVTVTDSKGCKTTCDVTMTQPDVLSCSIVQNAPAKCYGDSNGIATVTAVGGNIGYTYLWDNTETTAQAIALSAGNHTVTITDNLGYKTTCNVTIGQPEAAITCSVIQNKAVTANRLSDGQATVTPLGGNGGYTYLWDNGETTVKAVALNVGLHTVTVTDSKGCKTTCDVTMTQPDVLSCSIVQNAPAKCYGDSNGIATVTAVGGNIGYTYLWDNAETTAQAIALSAGNHTVTVTDNLGYKTTCNVTIGQPEAVLSATALIINNNNCTACNNGSIDLTASGGNLPYTFLWSNGATTEDISNLQNGSYSIVITDNKGCTANYTFIISESSINIVKDGTYVDSNHDGITNVGDNVTYSFVIKNTGTVDLTNVTLTDTNAIITGVPIPTLAVGTSDSTTFTGSHAITQDDINTGNIYNLATVSAKDPEDKTVTDTSSDPTPCTTCPINPECPDCTITPLTQSPSINITKDGTYVDSNQDGITNVGDLVTYNFVIKNTGNVTLTNIAVTDSNATITGGTIATLAVGATDSTTFSGSHIITQDDINTGYVYNLATVTAKDPKDNPVTDTSSDPTPCTTCPINTECPDCTITPLTQSPGLVVTKTTTTTSYSVVGDIINYTINVKNTGNVTLHQITVKDPLTGLNTIIESLAPGASSDYNQSYTATQEDLNKKSIVNVATADGFAPNDTPISATDDEIVKVKTNTIDAVDDNAGTIVGVNQITPNVINVFSNDTLNAILVNPSDVILTTVTSNPFLQLNPNGSIDVLPDAPVGTQTMTYQICEKLNTTNCDTATVTVIIVAPSMTVSGEGICINDVPYFSYTTTANNFTPVNGLTLTWTDTNNNVVATMTNLPLNGKVLWPGAIVDQNGNGIDWPGWILVDNKWIEGADGFENLRPTASVTFTLNPSQTVIANYPTSDPICTSRPTFKIDAVDDTAGPIDGINGATNILNVLTNDTLNTVAVNPADITLTLITADPTGYMTMNPDGSIDLKDGTPAGTYTLVYQICENADKGNCDIATVNVNVICNNATKIAGVVFNEGTNTPLANVPVTLIPQGTTTGPILIRITNAQGYFNFTGMVSGDYLLQVQDANLNSAYQLYPTTSSLFFTTLEVCKYQKHDFGYDKSDKPVIGDFVWYDTNNNGIQDEWYDANNDGLITQNIPDANGAFDYSKWEWIDLNGDGSYKGPQNVGELNAAGFGNAKSPNIFITGPNNFNASVVIGIQGYYRERLDVGSFGDYTVELKMDTNLEAQSSAMNATGLVKVIPNFSAKNANSPKTAKPSSFEVCGPTNADPQTASIAANNLVHLDIDFGISCKMFANIQATPDVYSVTQCSIGDAIRNALSNDLLNGAPANISDFKFKLLTAIGQNINIDTNGNVTFANGVAAGQYTFDYQVCEAANPTNCATSTITINVASIDPVTITSPSFCNADTTPIDLTKLLPEGIPTNGTWVDTDNAGGLSGNILNAFGIPVNTYHFEYKITGDCPRSVNLVMSINDDCKVLPCKAIIVHNAFSANEDGTNDYFQIENLEDNDCYKNIKVEVFNRWGVLVFEKDNYNNGSNAFRGKSEGRTTISKNQGLPTGTYFYIISYDTVDGFGKTENIKKDGYLYLIK